MKSPTSFRNTSRAFTLIELLVVIAIIALLLSVLMPSLKAAKDLAAGVKCMTNLRQIGTMTHNYFAENSDWIPFARHETQTNFSHYATPAAPSWASQLAPYAGIEPFDFCRLAKAHENGFGSNFIYVCPTTVDQLSWPNRNPITYAPGTYIAGRPPQVVDDGAGGQRRGKFSQVSRPSEKVWVNDAHKDAWPVFVPSSAPGERFTEPFTRHRGDTANAVYFDGHCDSIHIADALEIINKTTQDDPWWPWRKGEALPAPPR